MIQLCGIKDKFCNAYMKGKQAEESIHVKFDEITNSSSKEKNVIDNADDLAWHLERIELHEETSPSNEEKNSKMQSYETVGEFEMSLIGELNFFLGLQVKQLKDEIFVKSIQVHQGDVEEVQHGIKQTK